MSATAVGDTPQLLDRSSRKRGRLTPWFGAEWCMAKKPNTCLHRQDQMELCPEQCGCGNSLRDIEFKTARTTTAMGAGLVAARPIKAGEIVATFGDGLVITEEDQVRLIKNLIDTHTGAVGAGFQYSVIRKVPGERVDAIIMPEADRLFALTLTNGTPDADKRKCKRILALKNVVICRQGRGQFSNHTCCKTHLNAKLWLVSVARADEDIRSDKDGAAIIAILRAVRDIEVDQEILTSYRQIDSGHKEEVLERQRATLAKMFKCGCCRCLGNCPTPSDSGRVEKDMDIEADTMVPAGAATDASRAEGRVSKSRQRAAPRCKTPQTATSPPSGENGITVVCDPAITPRDVTEDSGRMVCGGS